MTQFIKGLITEEAVHRNDEQMINSLLEKIERKMGEPTHVILVDRDKQRALVRVVGFFDFTPDKDWKSITRGAMRTVLDIWGPK